MRKLIFDSMVSLDGLFETPDHRLDWVKVDEELHVFINDQQRDISTFLYGRRMYEVMDSFWPTADQDPSNEPVIIEYSRIYQKIPKVVFSKTLEKVGDNSRLVKGDAVEEVRKLKAMPGNAMGVGGPHLAASLIKADLIDEFHFFMQPVILRNGNPMFTPDSQQINLNLIETKTFKSGVIFLRYERIPAATT